MAKLSDLIQCTSEVTGIPVSTVREIGRRLRESGIISTGKGGRYGGADMTPKDAASLLTGLLISRVSCVSLAEIPSLTGVHLKDLTAHEPRVRGLVLARWDRRLELSPLCQLEPGHSFADGFAALITSFVNGEFERRMAKWGWVHVYVEIVSPIPLGSRVAQPDAMIFLDTKAFGDSTLYYIRRRDASGLTAVAPNKWSDIKGGPQLDLRVGAQIRDSTLKSVGLVLRSFSV
jgi:hypothetical protein